MRAKRFIVILWLAGCLLLAAAGSVWYLSRPILPSKITQAASFVIFAPPKHSAYHIQHSSYDADTKLLELVISRKGVATLTVTEQSTPDQVAAFPDMLKFKFSTLRDHRTLDTVNGKAYIGTNQDLNSVQISSLNSKGTLMFVRASSKLSADEWLRFYNTLQAID